MPTEGFASLQEDPEYMEVLRGLLSLGQKVLDRIPVEHRAVFQQALAPEAMEALKADLAPLTDVPIDQGRVGSAVAGALARLRTFAFEDRRDRGRLILKRDGSLRMPASDRTIQASYMDAVLAQDAGCELSDGARLWQAFVGLMMEGNCPVEGMPMQPHDEGVLMSAVDL